MHNRSPLHLLPLFLLGLCAPIALAQNDATDESPDNKPKTVERQPSDAELCGFLAAHQRLSRQVPLGRRVVVGLVEPGSRKYMPDGGRSDFVGKKLVPRSGSSKISGHANATSITAWGQKGLAPGVKEIHCFDAEHWLTLGYLRCGSDLPPKDGPVKIFNHSWVSDSAQGAEEVLRRVDYVIDANDVIMCVGVNNNPKTKIPELLAQAYNVIAVGSTRADGSANSSGGYTTIDGSPGRCKPDIVGPPGRTSFSTPVISAAVTRLVDAAQHRDTEALRQTAAKPQVVKAVLMTGAVKLPGWKPEPDKPLDEFLGAGRLHFDRALQIHENGPTDPQSTLPEKGWDFASLEPNAHLAYPITVPPAAGELAITLVWHRRVDPAELHNLRTGKRTWIPLPSMPHFSLQLIASGQNADSPDGRQQLVAESDSRIDNVQHIYMTDPKPGEYLMVVRRLSDKKNGEWPFALAWAIGDKPPP